MDNMITRAEHEEYVKRMDAENDRQNHRLNALEETMKQIHALTASVERLATNVERMVGEQEKQSNRLETLESRDGAMWRKIAGYALTAGVGFLLAALLRRAGIF